MDEVPDRLVAQPAKNVRDEPDEAPHDVEPAPAPPPRRLATPTVNTWTVNRQLRTSNNSTLTFRAPPAPWYRTKQATIVLVATASTAVAAPIVMLMLPDGPATGPRAVDIRGSTGINHRPACTQQRSAHTDQPCPAPAASD